MLTDQERQFVTGLIGDIAQGLFVLIIGIGVGRVQTSFLIDEGEETGSKKQAPVVEGVVVLIGRIEAADVDIAL